MSQLTPDSIHQWLSPKKKPLLFAGPCSVENEAQMIQTAQAIAKTGIATALRGGVWKPRTKPGSFEGIGAPALQWLKQAGQETNLPVLTEVANAHHVEEALKANIDMLWIGARTTVNPFYIQEIADALEGVDIPVFVKNPIHPEVGLWIGALERLHRKGVNKLAAIHRGFYAYQSTPFRNEPKWEVFFELKRLAPTLSIICDPSHIAGKPELIPEIAQSALDLGMDGFMIETHINPKKALSDAQQQITPSQLLNLFEGLKKSNEHISDPLFLSTLEQLRHHIDVIDEELLNNLKRRIDIVHQIGILKEENQAQVFQMKRWFKILENRTDLALKLGIDQGTVHELFQLIHKYSIDVQIKSQSAVKP